MADRTGGRRVRRRPCDRRAIGWDPRGARGEGVRRWRASPGSRRMLSSMPVRPASAGSTATVRAARSGRSARPLRLSVVGCSADIG